MTPIIPIWKSTYSIGKSILTLDTSEESEGPDSIITICNDHNIKTLVLVEDRMTGFIKAHNVCKENDIQLIFGLRLTCCNDVSDESVTSNHKIVIFSKNDNGCKLLNKISSHSAMNCNNRIDFKYLNSIWEKDDVDLVIPFYDSFIFNNQMYLANCVPDFSSIKPSFFWKTITFLLMLLLKIILTTSPLVDMITKESVLSLFIIKIKKTTPHFKPIRFSAIVALEKQRLYQVPISITLEAMNSALKVT